MIRGRYPRPVLQRMLFLLVGNVALLVAIRLLMKEGASFGDVLAGVGPNLAAKLLAALGLTGVILTGAVDLSMGAIIAVAGSVFGILFTMGAPPILAYAGCFLAAAGLPIINAGLLRLLGIQPIILTLAGLTTYRGLAFILAGLAVPGFTGNFSIPSEAFHVPGKVLPGAILILAVVVAFRIELFEEWPRRWLALGNSEEACRLQGLRPDRILLGAFVVEGLFLGLAALVEVTGIQELELARLGLGFELPVIGAVVLGGSNILGGEGSYAGTVLGSLFLYFAGQLLVYAGVSPYWQKVIIGGTIIAVIGLDCLLHRRQKRLEELR